MSSNGQDADLNAKVLKQLEYYFGDVNLQRDKFLQDEMKKDHGWVSIEVLLTFNRLKQITTDKALIAAALKDSELVDVSDDGNKIRRNPEIPIPENSLEFWQEVKTRTVYIKGFPPETTLDDIMEYLKPYGTIVNVVMRKIKATKTFKGSIFATFKDKESAENFIKNEEAKKYKDIELIRMMQNDYWAKEVAETKERKAAEKALKQQKKIETLQKEESAQNAPHFVKGQVMHVTGLPTENISLIGLKEYFSKFSPVAYAVYESGAPEASLRFLSNEENVAVKALEAMKEAAKETDGKFMFHDKEIECKVLEGEEEEAYWADFSKSKAARGNRSNNHRGNFNRRGGGRGTKRSFNGGHDFKNKRARTDENAGGNDDVKNVDAQETTSETPAEA